MEAIKYMTSLLTFYIKGEIATEQNFLKIRFPNTVLALIPLGSRKYNVPVAQISSVASNFKLKFPRSFSLVSPIIPKSHLEKNRIIDKMLRRL